MKITLLTLFFTFTSLAQDRIPSQEEAWRYFETAGRDLITYYTIFDDEELYELYARREQGDIIIMGTNIYRVKEFRTVDFYECLVLELDGSKHTPGEIEALSEHIREALNEGEPFEDLIKKYGDNTNPDDHVQERSGELLPISGPGAEGVLFTINEDNWKSYSIIVVKGHLKEKRAVVVEFAEFRS